MKSPLRLMVVIDKISIYGAERVAQVLVDELSDRMEIVLVTFAADGPDLQWRPPPGVKRVAMQGSSAGARAFVPTIRALRRVIRTEKPDVLLSFMGISNSIAAFASIGTGCRRVMSEHNVASLAPAVPKRWRRPFAIVRRVAYRRADRIVCVSNDVARDLVDHRLARQRAVVVIYNPIDVEALGKQSHDIAGALAWRSLQPPGRRLVVLVGALKVAKAHMLALRALRLLPQEFAMVFVGDGPERERLETYAADRNMADRVTFVGAAANPYGWMRQADVVIVPSLYEGFGLVAAEARAIGARLVATDVPGLREIVPLLGGTLVPAGDEAALAAAIVAEANAGPGVPSEWVMSLAPDLVAGRYFDVLSEGLL
jgi:glycosyltransferase involved in cell wall biosynthesis